MVRLDHLEKVALGHLHQVLLGGELCLRGPVRREKLLELGPRDQLIDEEIVLNVLADFRAQLEADLSHLLGHALLLQEMDLQLLPPRNLVVVLFDLHEQLEAVEGDAL